MPIDKLINRFLDIGYKLDEVKNSIIDLVKFGLLNTDDQLLDVEWEDILKSNSIFLTSKGYYYVKYMVGRFHYLDLVVQDTPIFEDSYYHMLISIFPKSDKTGKRSIKKRYDVVLCFLEYLQKYVEDEPKQVYVKYGKITDNLKTQINPDLKILKNIIDNYN